MAQDIKLDAAIADFTQAIRLNPKSRRPTLPAVIPGSRSAVSTGPCRNTRS